ncbi:type II toxin-antitoxin system RelB/DinJ family antitoxin [Escherichia coli]|jgi:DNA-damage-inducible protein J|nr:type II toxin-antitoxin system RelB/DinJ family antitoxin [Escherichia coli]
MANLNTTVRARIDNDVKVSAEAVLQSIGMEPSEAIRLFYQQIANRGEFPLELRVPNQTTIDAMNADVEPKVYKSADDLFNDL